MMWRPGKASRGVLVLVACISVLGYLLVEGLPQKTRKRYYKEKIQAAKAMAQGMEVIKRARIAIFGTVNTENDPAATGLIGSGLTPITSKEGVLTAKQTAANPNFAAVMVHLYRRAKLKEGDVVALAFSGSFPALNLASLVAAESLGLEPIIISSVSASRWGANDPELTWLDMERLLFENEVIHHRTMAASLGGEQDRGVGLPPDGVRMVREAIKRNGIELIDPPDLVASFDQRMNIYEEYANDRPIALYVNIGGGAGSVGSALIKKMFAPGLNKDIPATGRLRDSVMTRMIRNGVPVINLINIADLAKRYGLPVKPAATPRVGEGGIYAAMGYNMILAWVVMISLILTIFVLLRMDLKHYMLRVRNALGNHAADGAPVAAIPAAQQAETPTPDKKA
jgi:poly-gamma-glutamate system protein